MWAWFCGCVCVCAKIPTRRQNKHSYLFYSLLFLCTTAWQNKKKIETRYCVELCPDSLIPRIAPQKQNTIETLKEVKGSFQLRSWRCVHLLWGAWSCKRKNVRRHLPCYSHEYKKWS